MFSKVRKYYNYCRNWFISTFSNDPYKIRIRELEKRISLLRNQPIPPFNEIKLTDNSAQLPCLSNISVYKPLQIAKAFPGMVHRYRERLQKYHVVGDYIGDCYMAIKAKNYSKAKVLYQKVLDIDRSIQLDKKTKNKIEDLKDKYHHF